jgi:hypothetical protein
MTFEIWDRQSGNLVGEYPTPEEALELVREIAQDDGPAVAQALTFGVADGRQRYRLAVGADLIQLAHAGEAATA